MCSSDLPQVFQAAFLLHEVAGGIASHLFREPVGRQPLHFARPALEAFKVALDLLDILLQRGDLLVDLGQKGGVGAKKLQGGVNRREVQTPQGRGHHGAHQRKHKPSAVWPSEPERPEKIFHVVPILWRKPSQARLIPWLTLCRQVGQGQCRCSFEQVKNSTTLDASLEKLQSPLLNFQPTLRRNTRDKITNPFTIRI